MADAFADNKVLIYDQEFNNPFDLSSREIFFVPQMLGSLEAASVIKFIQQYHALSICGPMRDRILKLQGEHEYSTFISSINCLFVKISNGGLSLISKFVVVINRIFHVLISDYSADLNLFRDSE